MGPPGGDDMFWSVWFESRNLVLVKMPLPGTIQAERVSVGARRAGCKRVLKMKRAGGAMEREPDSSPVVGGSSTLDGEAPPGTRQSPLLEEDKLLYSALKGLVKQNMEAAVCQRGQNRLFSKELPLFLTEEARSATSLHQPVSGG